MAKKFVIRRPTPPPEAAATVPADEMPTLLLQYRHRTTTHTDIWYDLQVEEVPTLAVGIDLMRRFKVFNPELLWRLCLRVVKEEELR